jgi:ribosomal protein S18 acetylase RimI-like enzyme
LIKTVVNDPFLSSRIAHLYANREDLKLANPQASFPFVSQEWNAIFGANSQNTSLLFEQENQIIGHCALLVKEELLFLCFVILIPEWRGKKLARQILKETEEFVRLNYIHRELHLHVNKSNEKARKLYESSGYRQVWENSDNIQMKKSLYSSEQDFLIV